MRDRPAPPTRPAPRHTTLAVDVVPLTPRDDGLSVLLVRRAGRERWMLPWDGPREGESLDDAALRVARGVIGAAPALVEQIGAFGERSRRAVPGDAELSVGYVALVPMGAGADPLGGAAWFPLSTLPTLPARQRAVAERAARAMRARVDQSPVAFRLLPETFTLSELQGIYELLLGRRLHKASFRRALQAAYLVEPIDEWRSEGRGRPAQLFRYAPRKRRGGRRGPRFDLLGES